MHIYLKVFPTSAVVIVDAVYTHAIILARVGRALVFISAVLSIVSRSTATKISSNIKVNFT